MTAKSILTAIAAAAALVTGASSFTPAAEAHGIRLGFGVPLGSFVARPYAPDSYHARSHSSRKTRQHNSYAAARAARERESVRERAAVRAARAREREAERARAAALARAQEKAEARRQMAKLKLQEEPKPAPKVQAKAPEAAKSTTTEVALTQLTPITDIEELKTIDQSTTDVAKAEIEPQARPETKPEPEPEPRTATNGKGDCKKFIPAVGVTISVGCN